MGGCGPACELAHWVRKRSSFGGTIRVRGVPNWAEPRMRTCKLWL